MMQAPSFSFCLCFCCPEDLNHGSIFESSTWYLLYRLAVQRNSINCDLPMATKRFSHSVCGPRHFTARLDSTWRPNRDAAQKLYNWTVWNIYSHVQDTTSATNVPSKKLHPFQLLVSFHKHSKSQQNHKSTEQTTEVLSTRKKAPKFHVHFWKIFPKSSRFFSFVSQLSFFFVQVPLRWQTV